LIKPSESDSASAQMATAEGQRFASTLGTTEATPAVAHVARLAVLKKMMP